MKYFITLILIILVHNMDAQKLNGEYHLQGIPETASGFRFTPDGHFDFFFIYGAVDRAASGTYTIEGDSVKLHSEKEPGKDFPILKESKLGKGYTIQVKDQNSYLVRNIICLYHIGSEQKVAYSDDKGLITLEEEMVDKIFLMHELFPDVASLIKDEHNDHNHFEVGLSPSLVQVSFKGIDFAVNGKTLTCLPNYVIPFENIRYVKH